MPAMWVLGLVWTIGVFLAAIADFLLCMSKRDITITPRAPATLYIGASDEVHFDLTFSEGTLPPAFQAKLETSELLNSNPISSDTGAGFMVTPMRRGHATIDALWLRWKAPLGLVWRQVRHATDLSVTISPDVRSVSKEAVRMFSRDALFGQKMQLDRGDGSEFDALREFTTGMDKRTIDWKQSARHGQLIAKEYRNERNHPIHFVFDTGRLMSQPLSGVTRIDRAVNAALLMAYVSLKLGDRVGLFGFDERPRLATGSVSGASAFPLLQRHAARLDYSSNETNFTLGLTRLGANLDRRSLLVIFTDFADTTSAELMLENMKRLMKRHLVIFVAFQDEELEALMSSPPQTPEDVTRAVVAAELLKERDIVLSRLTRMGAQIVDTRADDLNLDLLNRYLDIKRRDQL
tara:strand:+ start:205 stop:1422 length:1218 start_codon:yes stop_codon:yes gene_type:complete